MLRGRRLLRRTAFFRLQLSFSAAFRDRPAAFAPARATVRAARSAGDLRLYAVARFDDELDFGFEAAHSRRWLRTARLVRPASRRWPNSARHAALPEHRASTFAQLAVRFEVDLRLFDRALLLVLLGARLVLAQQPQQALLFFAFGLQLACTSSRRPPALRAFPDSFVSSRTISSTRVRFSRVSCRRFSVSRRRSLYFDTPARFFQEHAQFFRASTR